MKNQSADFRKDNLYFYSQYCFLRSVSPEAIHQEILNKIENLCEWSCEVNGESVDFYYKNMEWESNYFNINSIKLEYVLYNSVEFEDLVRACRKFHQEFILNSRAYCYFEIPPEDHIFLQAMTAAGFRLIETRLHYYFNKTAELSSTRHKHRHATEIDIPSIRRASSSMRNRFDRFHADVKFDDQVADQYLGTFAENCVRALSDIVLVPNEAQLPVGSFMAASYLKDSWGKHGINLSKLDLAAVLPINKGWYAKLLGEVMKLLIEEGADYIGTNTQATNRSVLHMYEKFGFKYGRTTHILASN